MLYLATDHRGFELKEKIKKHLATKDIQFSDLGALTLISGDDYIDYARLLADKVKESSDNLGIALCGSGAGMNIALNRQRGILAGLAVNLEMARANRQEDNINVLVLPANFIFEDEALRAVDAFLSAKFDNQERRVRRLNKIAEL